MRDLAGNGLLDGGPERKDVMAQWSSSALSTLVVSLADTTAA